MKTNHPARHIVRMRHILSVLAVFAILGAEFGLGWSMAARVGQTSLVMTPAQDTGVNVSAVDWGALAR
jgi:hypothetical protein